MFSRDEQAKRARFIYSPVNTFKITFRSSGDGEINALSWAHEAGVSEDQQVFVRVESVDSDTAARASI